jgi:hypothetical protein
VTCHGSSGTTCTGTATFTTRVSSIGPAPVRVATPAIARKPKRKPKPKPKAKTVTVATARFSVPAGQRRTVAITLNATGRRLLSRFYKLPTRMRVTGAASVTRAVQFRYGVIDASVSFSFKNSASGLTTVAMLTPTTLPHRARVALVCHGRGCPFTTRVFTAHSRSLALAGQFHGAHLRLGTVVQLSVTAPFSVGEVDIFTMKRDGPTHAVRCLPPGAHRPIACA